MTNATLPAAPPQVAVSLTPNEDRGREPTMGLSKEEKEQYEAYKYLIRHGSKETDRLVRDIAERSLWRFEFETFDQFKYFVVQKRHKVSLSDRLTPCEWCAFPISQRHHLLPVSEHHETDTTLQLCANCHEIYHIVQSVDKPKPTKAAILKYGCLLRAFGEQDERLINALAYVRMVSTVKKLVPQLLSQNRTDDATDKGTDSDN